MTAHFWCYVCFGFFSHAQKAQALRQSKPLEERTMNLKKTIEDWATGTFPPSNSSYQVSIEQLHAAPPFLFTVNSGLGYCITIKPVSAFLLSTSAFSSTATAAQPLPAFASVLRHQSSAIGGNAAPATAAKPQLGFWIPESGAQGSQCTMRERDEEILTYAVDWSKAIRTDAATGEENLLANEDALTENLSALFAEFLRDEILLPALEKHVDDNAIAHEPFTIDTVSGIEPWDEKNWTFLFLPEPVSYFRPDSSLSSPVTIYPPPLAPWNARLIPPGSAIGSPAVLGLTGDGRAALFSYSRQAVDPRGYVDFINLESQSTGIDSPAALLGVWERINNPHWNSPEFKENSSLQPPATNLFNCAQA